MAKAEKKKLSGRKRDERVAAYIFVAPAVILLIAFLVVPMIYTVYFSGFKYQIMRPDAMKFIGFENYQKLFSDKNFWLALKNTVYFTVIVVPCQCVLALALALLVSKKFRGVAVFRTMYFALDDRADQYLQKSAADRVDRNCDQNAGKRICRDFRKDRQQKQTDRRTDMRDRYRCLISDLIYKSC